MFLADVDSGRAAILRATPRVLRGQGLQALTDNMDLTDFQFNSDFARRHRAQGLVEAVMRVLALREVEVPEEVRVRMLECAEPEIAGEWFERAMGASSAVEVFDDARARPIRPPSPQE